MGCQTLHPDLDGQNEASVRQALAALKSFKVKRLELDYGAKCRVRIKTAAMDENGSCYITITRSNRFRISILSPLGGTLLTVYQDDTRIQVINYHDKTALQLENSVSNRYKAFEIVNLNVAEFRSIFWGREIEGDKTDLEFVYRGERPAQIRRSDQWVSINKWMPYQDTWFPKIIVFEDRARQIYLKVVITSLTPRLSHELAPADIPQHFRTRN